MLSNEIKPWLFPVEAMEGESISHFLGRVRRRNHLTPSALANLANIGAVISRWEKFRFNPFPSEEELIVLGELLGIDLAQLKLMFPPLGVGMKCEPIRLCGACYAESPCHQIKWQFKTTAGCDRHQLRLLSKCPRCGKRFNIPSLWEFGQCERCHLSFEEMSQFQKVV